MRPTRHLLVAAIAATVLAGCGGSDSGSDDEGAVREVIAELTTASRAGDGDKICNELFSPLLNKSIADASKRPCAREVSDKLFSEKAEFDVKEVEVNDAQASATVTDQFNKTSVLTLVKQEEKWLISGVTDPTS